MTESVSLATGISPIRTVCTAEPQNWRTVCSTYTCELLLSIVCKQLSCDFVKDNSDLFL